MCCQVVESPDHASRLDQSVIQEFIVAHWVVKIRRKSKIIQSILNNLWNLTTWRWTYEVINKGVGVFRVTKQLVKAGETCKLCDCLQNKFNKLKYKTFLVITISKAKVSKIRPTGRLRTAHVKNAVLRYQKFSPAFLNEGYVRGKPLHLNSFSYVTGVVDLFLVRTCFFPPEMQLRTLFLGIHLFSYPNLSAVNDLFCWPASTFAK